MELSSDKTARNLVYNLSEYQWMYQYSIFIDLNDVEIDIAKEIALSWLDIFDDSKFRDYLRKVNNQVAILYITRKHIHKTHPSNKRFPQFYITLYTTKRINGVDKSSNYIDFNRLKENNCRIKTNYLLRKITLNKIQSTCHAIKKQALHDLSLLGHKKRFTIINRKHLIKK